MLERVYSDNILQLWFCVIPKDESMPDMVGCEFIPVVYLSAVANVDYQ